MMVTGKPIIFSDFDSTFAEKDIGYRLFSHFSRGKNQKLVDCWKKGQLSSRDCLLMEASMIYASLDDIRSFLNSFRLAPGVTEFYAAIKGGNIPFFIVSDGVDIYIDYILRKYDLGEIEYFSNRGIFQNGRMQIEFPHDNRGCVRCGCCKGARIIDLVGENRAGWTVIFIGDGLSDICAVANADIIFARGDLLQFCRSKNLAAIEYEDFYDILKRLRNAGIISG
jgi:2,3-diketo-5-methylthio-1-phosphopentane phosphatase